MTLDEEVLRDAGHEDVSTPLLEIFCFSKHRAD